MQVTRRKAVGYELEIEADGKVASTALIRLGHNSASVFKTKAQSGEGMAKETVSSILELLNR